MSPEPFISHRIVFPQARQAALIEEPLPPLPADKVLVEATCSLISSGTEMICYQGECDPGSHWEGYAAFPHHPGYSLMGTVAAVGEAVTEVTVGQCVVCAAGHCSHAIVSPEQLWVREVPPEIPDEQAAWAILGVITQTGVRMAEHVMGDSAVVIGLGPLGQLVVQYLRLLGLEHVLAVDPVASRTALALQHGATDAFTGSSADCREFVREQTAGRLADVVYDVTGHWAVLPTALPLARDHGKVVLLGDSPHPSKQTLAYDVVSRQVQVIGSRSSWLPPQHAAWTPQRMADLFVTYLQRGQMHVAALLTHRFTPGQAPQVYAMLAEKKPDVLEVLWDWRDF